MRGPDELFNFPNSGEVPKRARTNADKYPILYAVCILIVLGLTLFAAYNWLSRWAAHRTVKAESRDWVVHCDVTGRGEAKASEDGLSVVTLENQAFRDGVRIDRVYAGVRVGMDVRVPRGAGGVEPGGYRVYGTVTDIDALDKSIRLTDCVLKRR